MCLCRKSKSFATLGEGIEHKISEIWWTFATFGRDLKKGKIREIEKCLNIRQVIWHTLSGKKN